MLKPNSCDGCPLINIGNSFSEPEGAGSIGVTIIGEALGHEDAIDGKPVRPRSQAGALLEKTIKRLGFSRNQFKLWNLVACQPPGNQLAGMWYEERSVNHCRVHFNRVVTRNENNVIFATGNLPLKYLTKASGDAKEKQSVSYLRGFVLRGDYGLVVASFHPSFIRRGKSKYTEVFERDLLRAVKVAKGEVEHPYLKGWKAPEFQDKPSLDEVRAFYFRVKDNPNLALGCDIETPYSKDKDSGDKGEEEEDEPTGEDKQDKDSGDGTSDTAVDALATESANNQSERVLYRCDKRFTDETIITVQFSLGEREGISIPCEGEYITWIGAILALSNIKLWWNGWEFDIPRLRARGFTVNGVNIDLMWTFHHWQPDLDRNLQFVASYYGWPFPWKHYYGTRLGWYGCVDVAVLHWIKNRCLPDMKSLANKASGVTVYDGWKRFVQELNPLLNGDEGRGIVGARQRGIPVDEVERGKVKETLEREKEQKYKFVQTVTPIEIRNISPKREIGKAKGKGKGRKKEGVDEVQGTLQGMVGMEFKKESYEEFF